MTCEAPTFVSRRAADDDMIRNYWNDVSPDLPKHEQCRATDAGDSPSTSDKAARFFNRLGLDQKHKDKPSFL